LTGKVDAPDQALLSKSVKTIVDQVAAMSDWSMSSVILVASQRELNPWT